MLTPREDEEEKFEVQVEPEEVMFTPPLSSNERLAKSMYVPAKSDNNRLLVLEEKAEFADNQFWDLKHS